MARQPERVLLSWSGGKECVSVLRELQRDKDVQICGLLATVCEGDNRVTRRGIGRDVLEAQAHALGLPLEVVYVPKGCCSQIYTDHICQALAAYRDANIRKVAFGDLFLDDIRDFREECLEAIGMEAIFPLWQRDTKELSWSFVHSRYKAVITCVDVNCLAASFAGRPYDKAFLADLPLEIDPCGENGEFHTFVYDGPLFSQPVPIKLGGRYSEESLHFCEILPRLGLSVAAKTPRLASGKGR